MEVKGTMGGTSEATGTLQISGRDANHLKPVGPSPRKRETLLGLEIPRYFTRPDEDPYDNRTEFLTGYDPTDSSDFFTFGVVEFTGSSSTLELSKIILGTRYRVERSNDLNVADPWSEFTNFTTATEVLGPQLTDPAATSPRWFYRIGVEPE